MRLLSISLYFVTMLPAWTYYMCRRWLCHTKLGRAWIKRDLEKNPIDWFNVEQGREAIIGLAHSIADTYYFNNNVGLTFRWGADGKFDENVAGAIIFRLHPMFIPKDIFLDDMYKYLLKNRERLYGRGFTMGCDENNQLLLHITGPLKNQDPRPYRERAKVFRLKGGFREGPPKTDGYGNAIT